MHASISNTKFLNKAKALLFKIGLVRFFALSRKRVGALQQLGWFETNMEKLLVSGKQPKPWFVYGAIDYLEHIVAPSSRVLELGGGGSTLFWLNRGNPVTTIEQDTAWSGLLNKAVGVSGSWKLVEVSGIDLKTLEDLEVNQKFDVIVNDFNSETSRGDVADWIDERLATNGLIIWDNSDRQDYSAGIERLKSLGYGWVSFFGLGPINAYAFETTIFSKAFTQPTWEISPRKRILY
jgi:hypothetical protein